MRRKVWKQNLDELAANKNFISAAPSVLIIEKNEKVKVQFI